MVYHSRIAWLVMVLATITACGSDVADKGQPAAHDSTHMNTSITDVLARHTEHLMSIPGVQGTAEGVQDGRPCIIVFVKELTPEIEKTIPKQIEGYTVRVDAVGEIRPLR